MDTKSGLSSSRARRRASSPRGTTPPGCRRAGGDTGWSRRPGGSRARCYGSCPGRGTRAVPCKAQAMELELRGKTALITGGSRGIGLAMAARFAEAGANVMITSRKAGDLAEAAAGLVAGGAPGSRWRGGPPTSASPRMQGLRGEPRWRASGSRHPGQQRRDQPLLRPDDRHRRRPGAEDLRGQPALGADLDGRRREGRACAGRSSTSPRSAASRWSRVSAGTTSPRRPCCTSPGSSRSSWRPTCGSTRWRPDWSRRGWRPPVGGPRRGADRRAHPVAPARPARRHRHRRPVPGLRRRLVGHWADFRRRRGHRPSSPRGRGLTSGIGGGACRAISHGALSRLGG